jgi:hypothetical protein
MKPICSGLPIFILFLLFAAGCHKKEECPMRIPLTALIGYDSTALDTIMVYKTAHDNFDHVLDSFYGKGLPTIGSSGWYYIGNLTGTFFSEIFPDQNTLENGWIVYIPSTNDTFRYRSTEWRITYTKPTQEPDDCYSEVTELEINGKRITADPARGTGMFRLQR